MSILILNHDKRWGGGQVYISKLIECFLSQGHQVSQLVSPGSVSEKSFKALFGENFGYDMYSLSRYDLIKLIPLFRKTRILQIHREHELWMGLFAKLVNPKLRLIYFQHIPPKRKYWSIWLCNQVISNSKFIQAAMQRVYGLSTDLIYPPADYAEFIDLAKPESSPPKLTGRPVLMMSAAFYKRQTEMVKIFEYVLKLLPEARLYFIGPTQDPPLVSLLQDAIAKAGLESKISILLQLPRNEYIQLLRQIDFFVYAHLDEAFGLAFLEAAYLGKQLVAYASGGICETASHYPKTILIEPGERQSFAEAIYRSYTEGTYNQVTDTSGLEKIFSLASFQKKQLDLLKYPPEQGR